MQRNTIRFLRRGQVTEFAGPDPMLTVLDYLRLAERSRGTKEGCNEGDCGACTVALGSLRDGRIVYQPVNACILLMGQLDGKELVTVEDLAHDGTLHPVQQAMIDRHASQCGFCTPGFVMSLFALYHEGKKPTRREVVDRIAGNLCRCTGYRPIVDAALDSCTGLALDRWATGEAEAARILASLDDDTDVFIGTPERFAAIPSRAEALLALAADHPDATLVAGATDVGLWITKQLRSLPKIIHLSRVAALHAIADHGDHLSIGAAATYAEAEGALAGIDPDLGEALRRVGSKQVRVSGTIGGNVANGSPIGDTPPLLIALGATLHVRSRDGERTMPLEDYFLGYGRQDRRPGELVWCIDVPRLAAHQVFRCYKISKRFDQDISAVMAAFRFTLNEGRIAAARLAFGGMAPTPKRAMTTEAALAGVSLDKPEGWGPALAALAADFQPINDMRASADYRREVAQALLRKALMEVASGDSTATRVIGTRERAA
jgi:xanthine dehydrogenase small subunit